MQSVERNLKVSAYAILRERIITMALPPKTKLLEAQLMSELGIGRTPIREALLLLRGQGLVTAVPQSGTYVATIDLAAAENARFVRENLESKIAFEATQKHSPAFSEQLAELLAVAAVRSSAHDPHDFFQFDDDFHHRFYTAAGREDIWEWLQTLNAQLDRCRWLLQSLSTPSWGALLAQHGEIAAGVKAGDAPRVQALVAAHMQKMLPDPDGLVAAFPDYFEPEDK